MQQFVMSIEVIQGCYFVKALVCVGCVPLTKKLLTLYSYNSSVSCLLVLEYPLRCSSVALLDTYNVVVTFR
jgi:hypothetical protein